MAKDKKNIYDPKYAKLYGNIGQSMGARSSEDLRALGDADSGLNINYNPEFTSDYAQTGGPGYYQPKTLEGTDPSSNDDSWLHKTLEFIAQGLYNTYTIPEKIHDFDWTSAWNLTVKKQLLARLGSKEEELLNLTQEQKDLNDFSEFIDKYNQYKTDIQNMNVRFSSGDTLGAQLLLKDIENKYLGFQDQIAYYRQAIKTNPTLQKVMYDTSSDDRMEGLKLRSKVLFHVLNRSSKEQPDNIVLRTLYNAVEGVSNLADLVTSPFNSRKHVGGVIARGELSDEDLQKLQIYDLDHITGNILPIFKNDINKRIKDIQLDIDEKKVDVNNTLNLYRKGSWYYNPKNISKEFEQKNATNSPLSDLHEKGINSLLYSLPEVGSSLSSIEAFMAQLGIQWVGGAITKSVAARNPIAGVVAQVATQLGSVATAYMMRQDETNSEANDAYLSRVLDEAIKNKIDLGRILNITKQFCKSNGIGTDGLNEQDLLQIALSYNIQTGDSLFEKIKRDARQGINKLKAQNNALSYVDYIEALPFAGTGGSIIKDYAEKVARRMVYRKNLRYTAGDVIDAVADLAEGSLSSETKRKLAQGWISRKVDKILKKYGGSIEQQIAKRNLLHSVGSLGKKAAFVAAAEGIEEGQQAFLQNRYQRGVYDELSPEYDFGRGIDLISFADNAGLATESVLAYFGLDFGDPLNGDDQLRQQMEIGALTSLWFGLFHQAVGNITNNPESLRSFVNQYKFDKNLMRYVANNYKQQQDDVHLGMFFDSFRNGGNADKIARSYEAFKYLKNDEVVKDQDLDDDIKLARTAYSVYTTTNNKKNTILDDLNIARNSEDHKEYVKQASRVILDFENVAELALRSGRDLESSISDLIKLIKDYEEGSQTDNAPLVKSFKELIRRTHASDRMKNNDALLAVKNQLEELYKEYHKPQARPVLTDEAEIQKHKEEDKAREEEYLEKRKPLEDKKENLEKNLDLSEDDYADRVLTTIISLKQIAILKGLYRKLDTQNDKLQYIKKAFGYKINIESLYGMKNAIKDLIDKLEKKYKPIIDEGLNKKLLDKYSDLINDQSLNEKIIVNALNNGILLSLATKYQAYAFNAVDPRNARFATPRVKWENLTDEQRTDFLNNVLREKTAKGENTDNIDFKKEWIYRNKLRNLSMNLLKRKRDDIDKNKGTDKGMLPIDELDAIEKIEKDTALLIISQDMSDRFRRRQMVRLEREQESPLSIEDLDNANEGDQKAQQKIIEAAKLQQEEETKLQQQEEEEALASDKAKLLFKEDEIDSHQQQIDEARRKVYGERSDELSEKAKQKARRATLTDEALDKLISENAEGGYSEALPEGSVSEGTPVQEDDVQMRVEEEAAQKRLSLKEAINLLQNKPADDTTDPSIYLQQKLNISEEWADEFVQIYNVILNKQLIEDLDDEHPATLEAAEELVTEELVTEDLDDELIGGTVDVEIDDDGNVTFIDEREELQEPEEEKLQRGKRKKGKEKKGKQVTEEEENEEELHDQPKDLSAAQQLANDIVETTHVSPEYAEMIANSFIAKWVRGLPFEDCVDNNSEISDELISAPDGSEIRKVLQNFYDKYPLPQTPVSVHDPVGSEMNLNNLDVDDNGAVTYSGNTIESDALLFSGLYDDYDEQPYNGKIEAERSVVTSEIGNPFNYQPQSSFRMVFKHNGLALFADKQMATGAELNAKLSIPGWFGRVTKKYYIVTGQDKSHADDLTVAMIMEDPDNPSIIYNVTMREPSLKHFTIGEETRLGHIINSLRFLNVNKELYQALLNNAVEASTTAYNLKNKTELSPRLWAQQFPKEYETLQERCRLLSPMSKNHKVFTNAEIDNYLQKLRDLRKQIIDAYCTKNEDGTYNIPETVREDVVPQSVQLTNGSLNNKKDDFGTPIYRIIFGEDGGFNLGNTIDEVSEEIEDGLVLFGVGTGPFGENPGPNRIRPINGNTEEIPGTGKAGKLYIKIPAENLPSTLDKNVFVQLTEQKLTTELDPSDETVTESFTSEGVADLNNPPSLGEIAFRLITGRIDKQSVVIGRNGLKTIGLDDNTIEALSDLLINHGKQTLIGIVKPDLFGNIKPSQKNAYLSKMLGFYSDKQLAYIEHADGTSSFYIGDRDENGNSFLREYSMRDLFPGENASEDLKAACEKNRKHVISLIEKNMHWNTNIDILMSSLDDSTLYRTLDQFFFDDKKQRRMIDGAPVTVFNPFGNTDFSFSYDDFYNQDGSRKNPLVLAWMIKNGKLLTDVGTNNNDMFDSPFVFANGVKTTTDPKTKKATTLRSKPGRKPKTKVEKVIQQSNDEESGKHDGPNVVFEIPEDDAYKNVSVDKEKSTKTYLVTATTTGKTGKQLGWNKSNAEKLKEAMLAKFSELEKQGIKIDKASMDMFNTWKKFKGFNVFLHVKDDGSASLTIDFQTKQAVVSGVYSQKRHSGKVDKESARSWLQTTLGLSDDQVLVTNAIMKGLHNETVYGVTNLACSSIADTIYGLITLSSKGGKGLEYHEAWHYVNLLLHNRAMRLKIYEDYRSKHQELKGSKLEDIEEALAEDFRSYMLGFEDKSWSARTKRFFKNIKQVVKSFFGKPDIIYQAYQNIRKGKYIGAELDKLSIEEFRRNYPDGVYFEIPGLTNDQVTKFAYILNYHQYYQCAKMLCNKVMEGLDLSSVEKLKNYSKKDFEAIFYGIQQQIENDPESDNSKLLQDVVDNKDAFYKTVATMLKTFSIDVKHKKLKLDSDIVGGKDTGGVADNIWDIDHMEVSKKINVGFKAKLFFSTIPMYDVVLDNLGNHVYVPNTDSLFKSLNYWSFSKGWNKIMSELWSCDSFDAIDTNTGQYSATSLVGMVQRLSRSGDKFFYAMLEKLEPLIDEDDESMSPEAKLEIKTQILNTVQSSKNKISVLLINKPKFAKKQIASNLFMPDESLSEGETPTKKGPDVLIDIQKQWAILDSEHLQSKYILARTWSENLLSGSGIVETDPKTGDNYISSVYMQKLKQLINKAESATKEQTTQTQNFTRSKKHKTIEDAKLAVCEVLNYMAIPADGQVLQQLINTELSLNPKGYNETTLEEKERHVLRNMLKGSGTATILKLYGQLNTANRGKTITIGRNGEKELSEFYKGYSTVKSRINGKKTTKGLPWIGKLTVAYAKTYPSSAEMSVTGANGAQIYPINQNNAASDFLHRLQYDTDGEIENKKSTSYTQNSLIVQNAESDRVYSTPEEEKLHLNTFVCVKDEESGKSADYFGITPMEDYLAKFIMTYNKHLVFPTMADKKTWYSITSQWLADNLNTDVILMGSENPKLSAATIDIFAGYFIDELNSLKEYYSADNIKALLKNQNKLLVNFHGKVVTDEFILPNGEKYKYKHLNFDGNGGKFRYFYDISKNNSLNLNQQLELEYKTELLENQRRIELGLINEVTDGFERVRAFLDGILSNNAESDIYEKSVEQLRNSINAMLLEKVRNELDVLSTDENINLIQHSGHYYFNNGLPNNILKYYQKQIEAQFGDVDTTTSMSSAIYSAVANHTLRTMISVIEVEKIFTGDPAMYKWVTYKDSLLSKTTKKALTRKVKLYDGTKKDVSVSMLLSKDVDKIKRLGAVLSPGVNLKTLWTELEKEIIGDFGTSKYTFMNTSDVRAKSIYLDNIRTIFTLNEIVLALKRSFDDKYIIEHFSKLVGLDPNNVKRVEKIYYSIYNHPEYIDKILNVLKNTSGSEVLVDNIQERVSDSMGPYEDVTVSDAQVCLRPSMYRKLRISVGEWSFEEDETGYSDEKAYNIIENEDDWMSDPEKYAIGRRLMLKPLKMSYFSNSTTSNIGTYNVSLPVYNKMAMFPMFKYVCQSETGKALYDRMNMPGNEIDMLGFESAVKVGCNQKMYAPYKNGVTDLATMDVESLNLPSNSSINYQTGEIRQSSPSKKALAVLILDMNNLHLQLNTDAHETDERSIGTLMMKICFSNIDPKMRYGKDGQKGEGRLGSAIRNDIMNIINAMTLIGADNVRKRFFKKNKEGKYVIPNQKAIQEYVMSICENNDLGLSSEEIIRAGGKVASLTSRQIFEQSVSSIVNNEVVDINTNGGSAVQQSCFGFVGYGRNNVMSQTTINNIGLVKTKLEDLGLSAKLLATLHGRQIFTLNDILKNKNYILKYLGKKLQSEILSLLEDYDVTYNDYLSDEQLANLVTPERHVLNDGKPLRWYNGKGTMEVMLSMNFFKGIIPKKYKTDYTTMRQWLIDNDIINGTKSDGTQSDPKPYGVGYRIPTQGMSSTFGFIVADVLPETSGDLVIVPSEFTAQTGSDFDVDKLYLATYSYKVDGDTSVRYKTSSKSDMKYVDYLNEDVGALRNKLLDNYIDIISDYKNTADARASIDVLTSKLKTEIIPYLSDLTTKYAPSMYELLPSFLSRRKMEYSTGKSGIAPFALNVTNLAMTLATSLKMRFGDLDSLLNECFDFGNINDVVGKDGYMISAWLSAMVNAHVDVAKDPYILNLNVNSATYKYANFLLRTGQGMSTFTLLAQPALKRMANLVINSKGMYGQKLGNDVYFVRNREVLKYENQIRGALMREYVGLFLVYATLCMQEGNLSEEQKHNLKRWSECIEVDKKSYKNGSAYHTIKNEKDAKKILYTDSELRLLDFNIAKSFLKAPQKSDTYNYAKWCLFQAMSLLFIGDIKQAANLLSDLVSNSRIDTKKFGNNIVSQINFLNGYNTFKNNDNANKYFYIEDGREHNELPLYTYFEHTFLDKKLRYATQLTKAILRNLSFTATPLFGRTFNSTMAAIFGDIVYSVPKGVDKDGKPIYDYKFGYLKVMDDDKVQAIGKALESIFRHRAFLAYSSKFKESFDDVDLSLNNDERALKQKIIDLLYGDDKKPSIARRLSIMKASIKQKVFEKKTNGEILPDWLSELCDEDGVIKNEFLNYLNPILDKTGTYVDRIVLASSSMDVDSQYKSQLQSAFGELLGLQTTSTNPEDVKYVQGILRLAKDLILYAYYTTYNNGGVHLFFDLVPPTYRRTYDTAISYALRNGGNNDELMAQTVLENDAQTDRFGALDVLNILDVLCKNFWKDDNIVPTYVRKQKNISMFNSEGEYVIKKLEPKNTLNGIRNIPIAIALPISFNSGLDNATTPYIKIEYGSRKTPFLFKKIGTLYKVTYNERSGKETRRPFKNVYMITNKLGLQDGKNKQYEFFSDTEQSIFRDNNLTPMVGNDKNQTVGTPISLTEDEITAQLNVQKSKENSGAFKALGKTVVRLEYEAYRPMVLDDAEVITSDQELKNDENQPAILKEQETTGGNKKEDKKQTSDDTLDSTLNDTSDDTLTHLEAETDDGTLADFGAELDLSSLDVFDGVDLSGIPQRKQEELSELDKKESEQRKNDCKQ